MANDWFSKKIILLNKEKVHFSANAKLDKFFRKIIALNILSLWSCKKAILRATNITSYDNCHFFIARLSNISLFIKYIIEGFIFAEKLGYTGL